MVDLESDTQMWRALATKPLVLNRSCTHAEAQDSRSCVLVSSEKAFPGCFRQWKGFTVSRYTDFEVIQ